MNIYTKGDLVRVFGVFTDRSGTAFDPDTIAFEFRLLPNGLITTYVFGVDSQLVKDSVGNYHADINGDSSGIFSYRWQATGNGKCADEAQFEVSESFFG